MLAVLWSASSPVSGPSRRPYKPAAQFPSLGSLALLPLLLVTACYLLQLTDHTGEVWVTAFQEQGLDIMGRTGEEGIKWGPWQDA